jgi:hypothetical protein
LRWPRNTVYPQKLALISPTSGGRSVDIVRLRTKGHGVLYTAGRTPWTGDQPVARPLPTHRINARRHPCPRSQCSSGRRRFVPYTPRPLWSAQLNYTVALLFYLFVNPATYRSGLFG